MKERTLRIAIDEVVRTMPITMGNNTLGLFFPPFFFLFSLFTFFSTLTDPAVKRIREQILGHCNLGKGGCKYRLFPGKWTCGSGTPLRHAFLWSYLRMSGDGLSDMLG